MPQDEYFETAAAEREAASRLATARSNWGAIPPERRTRWCQAQLDFPPIWLGVFPMIATSDAVRRGEYTNISYWTDVAHQFEAIGFSPEDYYLLRLCISHQLRTKKHPKVIEVVGTNGRVSERLNPADWASWPGLVRAGWTPLHATGWILRNPNQTR